MAVDRDLEFSDRVKETSTTTGTGSLTLDGPVTGFVSFESQYPGAQQRIFYYVIAHQTASEWEIGEGRVNTGGLFLTRDRIIRSTNSDAAVNFSSGTKDVFVPVHAEFMNDVPTYGEMIASMMGANLP